MGLGLDKKQILIVAAAVLSIIVGLLGTSVGFNDSAQSQLLDLRESAITQDDLTAENFVTRAELEATPLAGYVTDSSLPTTLSKYTLLSALPAAPGSLATVAQIPNISGLATQVALNAALTDLAAAKLTITQLNARLTQLEQLYQYLYYHTP